MNRRNFIKKGAIVGAGLATVPAVAVVEEKKKNTVDVGEILFDSKGNPVGVKTGKNEMTTRGTVAVKISTFDEMAD